MWGNACIAARLGLSVADDLGTNFVKVIELLVGKMQKFTPLVLVGPWVCTRATG